MIFLRLHKSVRVHFLLFLEVRLHCTFPSWDRLWLCKALPWPLMELLIRFLHVWPVQHAVQDALAWMCTRSVLLRLFSKIPPHRHLFQEKLTQRSSQFREVSTMMPSMQLSID